MTAVQAASATLLQRQCQVVMASVRTNHLSLLTDHKDKTVASREELLVRYLTLIAARLLILGQQVADLLHPRLLRRPGRCSGSSGHEDFRFDKIWGCDSHSRCMTVCCCCCVVINSLPPQQGVQTTTRTIKRLYRWSLTFTEPTPTR